MFFVSSSHSFSHDRNEFKCCIEVKNRKVKYCNESKDMICEFTIDRYVSLDNCQFSLEMKNTLTLLGMLPYQGQHQNI